MSQTETIRRLEEEVARLDAITVDRARDLLDELQFEGTDCPVCDRFIRRYKRSINNGMAISLLHMYRIGGIERFVDVTEEIGTKSREEAKLRYWNLVEPSAEKREEGGKAGLWRVTLTGEEFVLGNITVPKYALEHAHECLELYGPEVGIKDCLDDPYELEKILLP